MGQWNRVLVWTGDFWWSLRARNILNVLEHASQRFPFSETRTSVGSDSLSVKGREEVDAPGVYMISELVLVSEKQLSSEAVISNG